jgi:hypothetical protein
MAADGGVDAGAEVGGLAPFPPQADTAANTSAPVAQDFHPS